MAKVGRPLKYKTVEEIQPLIDSYFKETPESEWTVTGLALALDTSRDILIDYEGRGKFSNAIKKAKDMVHNAYEKDLRKKGRSGDIFALKNFGWKDEKQIDANVNMTMSKLLDELNDKQENSKE
jgi:hypothetical protein